jgi:hypothetical protein
MGTGVKYTECSWLQVLFHRGFVGTGVSPQRFYEYSCQSKEGSWVHVLVDRGVTGTGVSPQNVHGHMC